MIGEGEILCDRFQAVHLDGAGGGPVGDPGERGRGRLRFYEHFANGVFVPARLRFLAEQQQVLGAVGALGGEGAELDGVSGFQRDRLGEEEQPLAVVIDVGHRHAALDAVDGDGDTLVAARVIEDERRIEDAGGWNGRSNAPALG